MSSRFARAGRYADHGGALGAAELTYANDKARAGVPIAHIARQMSCSETDLRRWLQTQEAEAQPTPPPPDAVYTSADACLFTRRLGVSIDLTDDDLPDSMRAILEGVSWRHGIPVAVLKGPLHRRDIVLARHEAMWRIYQTGRYSLPQIGRFLGSRHHTTILHGMRAHTRRMAEAEAKRQEALRA